ncbi:MAG TPA: N-acetylmuramoyl-L-alanine amidase [Streptosporangiaceae bacterium]|jgi:N-acetylmuramoyl-L-alanine amidase|nr:N-acetylmuramoyl-L-alanine amidase [Streptosporangiaceae bacterium]
MSSEIQRRSLLAAGATGFVALIGGCGAAAAAPRAVASPSALPREGDRPASAVTPAAIATGVLAGRVVGIDPGHNGRNFTNPAFLNAPVWNGREWEGCDTTGTETDEGYSEALFNFNVAEFLRDKLVSDGATVVMTRTSNDGLGPCVNRRSRIIDDAHADVAIDIHADGGPPDGRGFSILEPVADGTNDAVIASSKRFGDVLRSAYGAGTPMPLSDYYGVDGIEYRPDLAGLNLTTVPKVLIECGNMRNAADADLLRTTEFQRAAAHAMATAIVSFLR